MSPADPEKTVIIPKKKEKKDCILPDKNDTAQQSIGKALLEHVRRSLDKAKEEEGDGAKTITSESIHHVSRYLEDEYKAERGKIIESHVEDEQGMSIAMIELDKTYSDITISPEKAEAHLCKRIKEFEGTLEESKGADARKARRDIKLITADVKQLNLERKLDEMAAKMEFELGYIYLPSALKHEKKKLVERIRDASDEEREPLLNELAGLRRDFRARMLSPSKAAEYLLGESNIMKKGKAGDNGTDRTDKQAMIECDLETARRYMSDAAPPATLEERAEHCTAAPIPARRRFPVGNDFEAISNPIGTQVVRMNHRDGTQVAFLDAGEVRVVSTGANAIFRDGKLAQLKDGAGNVLQYADGKVARVIDAAGNNLAMEPGDEKRNVIVSKDGRVIYDDAERKVFFDRFKALIAEVERAQLRGGESGLDVGTVLARANGALEAANVGLASINDTIGRREAHRVTDSECIVRLSNALKDSGDLSFKGEPTPAGFDARFIRYGKKFKVTVLPLETVEMLREKVRKNHPANVFADPETTLVIELPEMLFKDEPQKEHPTQYVRVFTLKMPDGKDVSILALHTEMVEAIRADRFATLGKRIYDKVKTEMNDDYGYFGVRFKLDYMPHSEVCEMIRRLYGEAFLDAMRRKDYNALGRQEVFDNLVHNVTHTFTRHRVRAYQEQTAESLHITAEDEARANEYVSIRMIGAKTEEQALAEIVTAYMNAFGLDLPTEQQALDNTIADLRAEFFAKPTKENYLKYIKADIIRDMIDGDEERDRVAEWRKIKRKTGLSNYHKLGSAGQATRAEECRKSFCRIVERELLEVEGKAVGKAIAIALQRTRYHSRPAPTSFSMSVHLQDIGRELGAEALYNEVSGEVTSWDVIRRANQLRDISKGFDYSFVEVINKLATKREYWEEVKLYTSIAEKLIGIATKAGPAVAGLP